MLLPFGTDEPGKYTGGKVLGKQMEMKISQWEMNQKICMRSL